MSPTVERSHGVDHNSRIRVSSIRLSHTSYYENSPSKNFFPTSRSSQESEAFLFRRATYKGTYVEAAECAKEGGLSPQEGDVRMKKGKRPRKARRWLQRRQGSVCPTPRISFFGSRVFGFWETRLVWISAPTRLSLRGSHVRRKFRNWSSIRSESSTLKGLLYAGWRSRCEAL